MEAHERLAFWWRATGKQPADTPAGDAAAREIEQRHGLLLPDDFRAYLCDAAPVSLFYDCEETSWLAPSEIKTVPEELATLGRGTYELPAGDLFEARAHTYLVFADYMMWCWCWAICCDEGAHRGKVAVLGGLPNHFVANSFTAFIDGYITDLGSVC